MTLLASKLRKWELGFIRTASKVHGTTWNSTPHHPKTPEAMATKIGRGDYVPNIYPCAKLHYDPIRGLCPHICKVAYQMFTRLVFWVLPSSNSLPRRLLHRFWPSIPRKTSFRTRMCVLGVQKTIFFYILTPISPKNKFFWSIFDKTENFGSKQALTWGTSSVDTAETTSYAFESWMMSRQIDPYKST